ncbi:hypothetical protein L1049_011194 [Liquidambar formosana]|uniref:Pectinesterase inhibitor domain-containing protein n=1 Tax=Liquidambar formosana TaxID=63359 RepID=A0AAP0WWV4_LIQFO
MKNHSLFVAMVVAIMFSMVANAGRSAPRILKNSTLAISQLCNRTPYPEVCLRSFANFLDARNAFDSDLQSTSNSGFGRIFFDMTVQRFQAFNISNIFNYQMDTDSEEALKKCQKLLNESLHALSNAQSQRSNPEVDTVHAAKNNLAPSQISNPEVHTVQAAKNNLAPSQLSNQEVDAVHAAKNNLDTCRDELSNVSGNVKDKMGDKLEHLWELVCDYLAIYSGK